MLIDILFIILLLVALFVMYEIFRRYPIFALIVFLGFPMFFWPIWHKNGITDIFLWAKIYSVCIAICGIIACRYTKLRKKRWPFMALYFLLALNIAEAVMHDIIHGNPANILNATAGILLIVTIPWIREISVDEQSPFKDLCWDMSYPWIIGYTIWNWLFVFLNYSDMAGCHIAVLGAPLLVSFVHREHWLQARAFTLGSFLMVTYTFKSVWDFYSAPYWGNQTAGLVIAIIVIAFVGIYTLWFLFVKFSKKS